MTQTNGADAPSTTHRLEGKNDAAVRSCLFIVLLLLYILTRSYDNTFDAVSYANQIAHLYPRTGNVRWLFHPHHLLFNATGYVLWRSASALGRHASSLTVLETLNAILGSAGMVAFYGILMRTQAASRSTALVVTAGLALTFGYWICATDGRVNMPSTVLIIAAFGVLCRLMRRGMRRDAAAAGLLAGAAALYHESAALFVVVGGVAIWLTDREPPLDSRPVRMRLLAAYSSVWAATVALPYVCAALFALHLGSPAAFHAWMTTYSELGWWWSFDIGRNIPLDVGALRHAVLADPPARPHGLSGAFFWAAVVAAVALAAGALAGLSGPRASNGARTPAHSLPKADRKLVVVCAVWFVLYAAFFTVWSPGYFVFWTPALVPMGVAAAIGLERLKARLGRQVLWIVCGCVCLGALYNFEAAILPHHRALSDPFRRAAADVKAHTAFGDIVIVPGAGDGADCEVDIPYFADRDVLSIHTELTRKRDDKRAMIEGAQAEIRQVMRSGHAVYVMDDGIPPAGVAGLWYARRTWLALESRHGWTNADQTAMLAPYTLTPAWTGPRGPVWRVNIGAAGR
jgi:hypothetical protein